jgi:hypothetical protein
MTLLAYARTQMRAAAQLMRFDSRGLAALDSNPGAAVLSFYAAVILVPGVAILVALQQTSGGQTLSFAYVSALSLSYIVAWLFYLTAIERLSRWMGVGARFPAFVAAYNWTMAVQVLVFVPTVLLASFLLPDAAGTAVILMVNLLLLVCQSFVTQTALSIGAGAAVGFVALDVICGVLINTLAGAILRAGASV